MALNAGDRVLTGRVGPSAVMARVLRVETGHVLLHFPLEEEDPHRATRRWLPKEDVFLMEKAK